MIQKPSVKVRPRKRYKKTPYYFHDNNRRICFKYMKKQEEKLLGKEMFNVYEQENWLA